MHLFFMEVIKYDYLLTIENQQDTNQIQLATNAVLTTEEKF